MNDIEKEALEKYRELMQDDSISMEQFLARKERFQPVAPIRKQEEKEAHEENEA